jgi:hypothetical protein
MKLLQLQNHYGQLIGVKKYETDLSNELIPSEWLTQSTTETSETKQKGVEIEPEMLQQFRSAEAELLLVDL